MTADTDAEDEPRTVRLPLAVSAAGWRLRDGRLVIAFVVMSGLPPIAILNDGTEVSISPTQRLYPTNWQFPDPADLPPLPPSRPRTRPGHGGRTGI